MARTRSPDYDSIQELILERTATLFASRGYVATSIGDIAEACQCSKSRLYHYFDSKEAILIAMLSAHVDRLRIGAREIVAAHNDPMARFCEITRYFMGIYAVSRAQHVVLLTCMEFLPEASRREIIDKQRELVSYVRNILKAIHAEEGGQGGTTDIDTMLFFGMINWTYTWYRAEGTITPQELADRSVRIFTEGYRAVSATPTAKAMENKEVKAMENASAQAAAGVKTLVGE